MKKTYRVLFFGEKRESYIIWEWSQTGIKFQSPEPGNGFWSPVASRSSPDYPISSKMADKCYGMNLCLEDGDFEATAESLEDFLAKNIEKFI
jgi:hypothetical protein